MNTDYDQGWKDGYKHGAWASEPVAEPRKQPAAPVSETHKWVGLTEQEWERLVELYGDDPDILIRETEAKLRAVNGFSCDATEKNRGKA
jgi:hypothetical protein